MYDVWFSLATQVTQMTREQYERTGFCRVSSTHYVIKYVNCRLHIFCIKSNISIFVGKGHVNLWLGFLKTPVISARLTLLAPGFMAGVAPGEGVFHPPYNSFVFKVRLLKFCTELLWDKMNILR